MQPIEVLQAFPGFCYFSGVATILTPMAYLVMDLWLNNYVFRIPLGWDIFAIGLFITTVLTMLTIGYISLRAARTNPAETLQIE